MSRIILSNFFKNILLNPAYRVFRHFLLIIFFLIISFNGALFTFQDDLVAYNPPISLLFIWGIGYAIMYLIFGYFILYSMIPKYLNKKRYTSFILFLFLGSLFLTVANLSFEYFILQLYHISLESFSLHTAQFPSIRILFNLLIHFVCFGSLLITVLLKNWFINTKKVNDLEQFRLQKELEQLKGSINPNFLFDVLDHASLLAIKNPVETSEIILKLGKLLRYQLYESTKEKVLLISEIQFLNDFLILMKLLYKDFHFHIESTQNLNLMVPPLLFISILNEGIKGIQNREISSIDILFKEKDTIFSFICKYNQVTDLTIEGNLDIVKQRLDLLYTDRYNLKFKNNKDEYFLQLDISI